jgi:rRNA maturation endonuclease Nob1
MLVIDANVLIKQLSLKDLLQCTD